MPNSSKYTPSPISPEDLIALNDEIASLVRAGVPLELGLHGLAGSASGRLAEISALLAQQLSAGHSIADALASEKTRLPRVYRAVIEAGIKAGRLPQALESVSRYARILLDVRRGISLAMIYPCIVILVTYYLFWHFVGRLSPEMGEMYRMSGEEPGGLLPVVNTLYETVDYLGHFPPAVLVLCMVWWLMSSRLLFPAAGIAGVGLQWFPGLGWILKRFHLANFSELTAILLEQGVPLHEALQLAADSTGNAEVILDAQRLSDGTQRGDSLVESVKSASSFPPFMQWMIASGDRQGALVPSFYQISQMYRRIARRRTEWFKLLLPILLTMVFGGGAVLIYVLSLFVPLTELLRNLGLE
jgi:general secretion pathway protein F